MHLYRSYCLTLKSTTFLVGLVLLHVITLFLDLRKQFTFNIPNAELVFLCTEQKLRHLAEFLLHVQQDDQDCHCVLVTRTATSPDSTQPFLTSRVSLTLTRQQRARDCDDLSPAGVSHHGGIKGDNCHSMGRNCGSKKAGCGESSRLEGSEVVVESKDLVDLASGVENDKPGFHLHIRVSFCLSSDAACALSVSQSVCLSISFFLTISVPVPVFLLLVYT